VAAKAVIVKDGKVLILREALAHDSNTQAGHYQLPGGRVEPGEVFSDALAREIFEETGLEIEQEYPILVDEWRPVIKNVPHQIIGIFVVCRAKSPRIRLSDEHDGFEWIKPVDHQRYNVLSPDWQAIVRYAEWAKQQKAAHS